MKKLLAVLLALTLVFALTACFAPECTEHVDSDENGKCDVCDKPIEPEDGGEGDIMTHAEYVAAADNAAVKVKTYVQAKQSWWDNKGTFYTQAPDGAYFLYNMPCTEEQYNALVPGTCIIVSGFKADYAGEKEIIDATYEIVPDDTYVATAKDLTAKFANGDDLFANQNEFFTLKGATVVSKAIYNWDGTGSAGNDLYLTVSIGAKLYTLVVESYLTGDGTEVYDAVEALEAGNVIDAEGFLYWYNGAQPHLTKITVTDEGNVSTHAEFVAAEDNTEHTIITYVQAKQSWWDNKGTFYTQAPDGAYFLYNMPCTEDEYNELTAGTCIMVTGFKTDYAGEKELIDTTFTILGKGGFSPKANDLTDAFANADDLFGYQNEFFTVKGATVTAKAVYNWDGTGSEGNDLYLAVTVGDKAYTFVVESYLTGNGTENYDGVEALEIGDVIDVEGYLYWYNGAQPHIVKVTVQE